MSAQRHVVVIGAGPAGLAVGIAAVVGAERAGISLGERAADRAEADAFAGGDERAGVDPIEAAGAAAGGDVGSDEQRETAEADGDAEEREEVGAGAALGVLADDENRPVDEHDGEGSDGDEQRGDVGGDALFGPRHEAVAAEHQEAADDGVVTPLLGGRLDALGEPEEAVEQRARDGETRAGHEERRDGLDRDADGEIGGAPDEIHRGKGHDESQARRMVGRLHQSGTRLRSKSFGAASTCGVGGMKENSWNQGQRQWPMDGDSARGAPVVAPVVFHVAGGIFRDRRAMQAHVWIVWKARQMLARCCMPPESCHGNLSS